MCEYCERKIKYITNRYEIDKCNDENEEYTELISVDAPANYCSNCGRRLEE